MLDLAIKKPAGAGLSECCRRGQYGSLLPPAASNPTYQAETGQHHCVDLGLGDGRNVLGQQVARFVTVVEVRKELYLQVRKIEAQIATNKVNREDEVRSRSV
jgi:hypothetical protein